MQPPRQWDCPLIDVVMLDYVVEKFFVSGKTRRVHPPSALSCQYFPRVVVNYLTDGRGDHCMVDQAVNCGSRCHWVLEDPFPITKDKVTGDDDALPLVTL